MWHGSKHPEDRKERQGAVPQHERRPQLEGSPNGAHDPRPRRADNQVHAHNRKAQRKVLPCPRRERIAMEPFLGLEVEHRRPRHPVEDLIVRSSHERVSGE
eukprot:Amastigsp_a843362_48.p5 type:complete len:101 gc:universal Amastigsp_a843362_48:319-17(-)